MEYCTDVVRFDCAYQTGRPEKINVNSSMKMMRKSKLAGQRYSVIVLLDFTSARVRTTQESIFYMRNVPAVFSVNFILFKKILEFCKL